MKDDIQTFDVVVIGAGPGGYVSAQNGFVRFRLRLNHRQ